MFRPIGAAWTASVQTPPTAFKTLKHAGASTGWCNHPPPPAQHRGLSSGTSTPSSSRRYSPASTVHAAVCAPARTDDEQWFDHTVRSRGGSRRASLIRAWTLQLADHPNLVDPQVAQGSSQVVLDGDGLQLQQLAVGQRHPHLLAAQHLHMHRTISTSTRVVGACRARRYGRSC